MTGLGFYLSNGAVDVVGTVASVLVFVQITKPIIESIGTARDPHFDASMLHDSIVELYAAVLSLAAVFFLWNAGPGFHSAADYGAAFLATVSAVASEFGIYAKLRGPVPATPNVKYTAALARMGLTFHGTAVSQNVPSVSVGVTKPEVLKEP